jgi:hypothetical protein
VGESICDKGVRYLKIRLNDGQIGWTAEGDNASYWVEPVPNNAATPAMQATATLVYGSHPELRDISTGGIHPLYLCRLGRHGDVRDNKGNAYQWQCQDGYILTADDFNTGCQLGWGAARPFATLAYAPDKNGWKCMPQQGFIDP